MTNVQVEIEVDPKKHVHCEKERFRGVNEFISVERRGGIYSDETEPLEGKPAAIASPAI